MNRRERDFDDRNNYSRDTDSYAGYSPEDAHYHHARNLTNEFEQRYQGERGYREDDGRYNRPERSYHEGDMGDAYERYSRKQSNERGRPGNQWSDSDRDRSFRSNLNNDRDRYSNYQDDYRSYQGSSDRDRGSISRGYGISDYEGTSDRYNTLGSDDNRRNYGVGQEHYSRSGEGYRNTGFGGMVGDSSVHSDRGIPNYSTRNYSGNYNSDRGSSYVRGKYNRGSYPDHYENENRYY